MTMQDPIADLLTRIRNAQMVRMSKVSMPHSKIKKAICDVLKEEGFISDFSVSEDSKPQLEIGLRYAEADGSPVIETIQRVSRPGLRKYVGRDDIPRVQNGLGIAILSTNQGVMTDKSARKLGIGGEVICTVF